jgi:hypothetical protein
MLSVIQIKERHRVDLIRVVKESCDVIISHVADSFLKSDHAIGAILPDTEM